MTPIQQKLSEQDAAELKKCQEDPVYFYNKYAKPQGRPDLTKEEYDNFVQEVERVRNTVGWIHLRNGRTVYLHKPLTPKDIQP